HATAGPQFVKNATRQLVIAPLDLRHFPAVGVFERQVFVGQDLHLHGVAQEVLNVIRDQRAQTLPGFEQPAYSALEALQDARKRMYLDEIEELLLALEIVVETRERNATGPADVADRSPLEALFTEHARGLAQNALQLGLGVAVVVGSASGHGNLV